MILYLVRHAESVFNREGRIQGQSDPPLSEEGGRQAAALAEALGRLPIDAVYSSPLRRAYDTAQAAAALLGREIQVDDRLMEIHAGIFQEKLWQEVEEEFPQHAAQWKNRDVDFVIPGGESRRDLARRAHAALRAVRAADGGPRVAVVAHGGPLSAGIKELLGIPLHRNAISLMNASISQVHWPDPSTDSVELVTLNEIEHLRQAGCATRPGDL